MPEHPTFVEAHPGVVLSNGRAKKRCAQLRPWNGENRRKLENSSVDFATSSRSRLLDALGSTQVSKKKISKKSLTFYCIVRNEVKNNDTIIFPILFVQVGSVLVQFGPVMLASYKLFSNQRCCTSLLKH